ncbi:unnamed protein product [Symbiodinium natans]|uniref:Uncharacterized protein n=1 Tax=Symbiodinium natans TaxID=878477 RepID=A0A812K9N2_9DINO|nr:unnamed protein product [Symbiodinium natans]
MVTMQSAWILGILAIASRTDASCCRGEFGNEWTATRLPELVPPRFLEWGHTERKEARLGLQAHALIQTFSGQARPSAAKCCYSSQAEAVVGRSTPSIPSDPPELIPQRPLTLHVLQEASAKLGALR